MFNSLQKIFNGQTPDHERGVDDLRIATCVLLLEAAHADRDFSTEEKDRITDLIAKRFNLSAEETVKLLAAAEREREQRDDLYYFARLVNEQFNRGRKLAIIELLWDVVYSDHVLEAHEDALMHKFGNLLGIRHDELIALKVKVKGKA